MSPRIRHFLEKAYEPISILLNLGLVVSGVWLHATWEDWHKFLLAAAILAVLGIVDFWLKRTHDRSKVRSTHERYIDELLHAAAFSILRAASPPIEHIRVNIMMPSEPMPNDGARRLIIRYKHGFDFGDQDLHIRVPVGTGCAGRAFLHNSAIAADVTELSRSGSDVNWGLPHDEIIKVRSSLKSIFSVPIIYGNGANSRAILNIDSDNTIDEIGFNDESIQKIGFCFAETLRGLLEEMS